MTPAGAAGAAATGNPQVQGVGQGLPGPSSRRDQEAPAGGLILQTGKLVQNPGCSKEKGSSCTLICLWSSISWTYHIRFLRRRKAAGKNKTSCFLLRLHATSTLGAAQWMEHTGMSTATELWLMVCDGTRGTDGRSSL